MSPRSHLDFRRYDHRGIPIYPTDFDAAENVNVANHTDLAPTVALLSGRIRAQFGNTTGS
jgi:hypothetical protein